MHLLGVELAPLARADDVNGVGDGGWPVETLPEGVADEGPWCCVMTASPRVYILEDLPALVGGDTALQDPGWAPPV